MRKPTINKDDMFNENNEARSEYDAKWSAYQTAVFDFVRHNNGSNAIVQARAGAGKTTLVFECFKHLRPFDGYKGKATRVLYVVFNKQNAQEAQDKLRGMNLPDGINVDVKTCHSVGMAALRRAGRNVKVDFNKLSKHVRDAQEELHPKKKIRTKVKQIVSLAKSTGVDHRDEDNAVQHLLEIAYRLRLPTEEHPADMLVDTALQAMSRCYEDKSCIDFDDMIWLPYLDKCWPWPYQWVFIDETQDLCKPQIWLARSSMTKNGRAIAVGDRRQAIYAWRGADQHAFDSVRRALRATELNLPITYRCSKAVVEYVKQEIAGLDDFQAFNANKEGNIAYAVHEEMVKEAREGDFILSRTNAPLLSICLALLKRRRRAYVRGREVGAKLKGLIEEWGGVDATVPALIAAADTWRDEQTQLLSANIEDEDMRASALEAVLDEHECLTVLARDCASGRELVMLIDDVFDNDSPEGRIMCSTAHRAKGLESDTVWMLDNFGAQGLENENVRYVAMTRSADKLVFVV